MTNITKETAEQIVHHMKSALELDPHNELIKITNSDRIANGISMIEKRIARGDFPMISKLRERFNIQPTKENDDERTGNRDD